MMQEVSDLQKKRAYNLIWNAAADYTFAPDFKFYTEEGNADIYWNSILGLARKHYDYEQLKKLFRSLETEEEAGEYESLLWLGLENALVAKEQETRPALPELQKQYAQRYLDRYGGDLTEDDRFFDFLAKAHYRRVLGLEEQLSRYDRNLLDELEFSPELNTGELIAEAKRLLLKWFQIRAEERAEEHRPWSFPGFKRAERRKRGQNKLRRFGTGFAEHPRPDDGGSEMPDDWMDRRSSLSEEELRAFMAEKYGKALLPDDKMQELEKKLCTGNHKNCHLHITRGEAAAAHIRNGFEALQKEREQALIARNRATFHAHEAQNRIAIARLVEKIQNSVLLYLQPDSVRADAGELEAGRTWRALNLGDRDVFRRKENSNAGDLSVDILLDASTSQKGRLESISGQAFCIVEALTRCGIPCRVMGFCSMTGYTIVRIFRDYRETNRNGQVFEYVSNGCNRDGLAVRVVHSMMNESACEHRLLIILSDVKPQDIVRVMRDEEGEYVSYEKEIGIRDTAYEVRRARADGIAVICVFTGDDEDLPAAKTVYGRDFARIRSVDQLADTVGLLIQNQIKNI
ncbi:MAG: hypothetical protein IJH21_02160 [Oscillospiraceae bacterium]|nr:hypothetical protein [Oscillospiraceae bacterium]